MGKTSWTVSRSILSCSVVSSLYKIIKQEADDVDDVEVKQEPVTVVIKEVPLEAEVIIKNEESGIVEYDYDS